MSSDTTSDIDIVNLDLEAPSLLEESVMIMLLIIEVISCAMVFDFYIKMAFQKIFRTRYYGIVALILLQGILICGNTWIGYKLKIFPGGLQLLKNINPDVINLSRTLFNMFLHIQFWSSNAQNVHHVVLMHWKEIFKKYWKGFFLLYVTVSIGFSSIPYLVIGRHPAELSIVNGTLFETRHYDVIKRYISLSRCFGYFYLACCLITIAYPFVYIKLCPSKSDSRLEFLIKRTRLVAFILFLFYIPIVVWCHISSINPDGTWWLGLSRLTYLMIFNTLWTWSPIYVLMITDNHVREYWSRRISKCIKKPASTQNGIRRHNVM